MFSKNKVIQTFKLFDQVISYFNKIHQMVPIIFLVIIQDGNGNITRQELEQILGGTILDDKTWASLLEECDKNKDGQVHILI